MGSARSNENEDADFRRAVADAQPLESRNKLAPPARKPAAPFPRQRLLDERAALAESLAGPVELDDALESGNELVFLRQGYPRETLRRLRRGHWVVEDELDLHSMNRHQALSSTNEFLKRAARRRLRCVRVVHGKGRGSRQREPVLKGLVRKWLVRADVLAFCQAPAAQGGSGAVLVLLKT